MELDSNEPGAESAVARLLMSEVYSGNFAHPSILKGLNEVVKNGAERAFSLTEKEQQHRHDCDKIALNAEVRDGKKAATDRRMVIIFLIAFVSASLSAAFTAAWVGNLPATAISGLTGVALAIAGLVKLAPRKSGAAKEDKN
jgi:uncharacterized membrane protein